MTDAGSGLLLAAGVSATVSLPVLAGSVAFGSIIPVLPTGPIVAAAAAYAWTQGGVALLPVLVISTVAAFVGDVVTFAASRSQGSRLLGWLARRHPSERLDSMRARLAESAWRLLIVGRVLPAGRIPVLLAAGAVRYPWRSFLPVGVLAAAIWAAMYAVLGIAGGSVFTTPLNAVIAAVVLSILVAVVPTLVQRVRARR